MLNFTVGPVMSNEKVRSIGAEQVPYFRTGEFSQIIFENEKLMKKFLMAGKEARVVFLTGSGTAAMEAAVINTLTSTDRVLIVNGGSFGQRFVDLCEMHRIPYAEILLETGKTLEEDNLNKYNAKDYTAFLVNVHETSTGVFYDLNLISDYCKRNGLFLIVDAISSFLADRIDMGASKIDVLITSSQKALACPPGLSILVLSEKAIEKVNNENAQCMYLNLKDALKDSERGQTPFTPAVSILLQVHSRLKDIEDEGGVEKEIEKVEKLARDFRAKIKGLPLEIMSNSLSNAVTPLHPIGMSAYDIFTALKGKYGIWVCPNGGELANKIFRVGHIGYLSTDNNTTLVNALEDLLRRN